MRMRVWLLLVLIVAGCASATTDTYTLSSVPPARGTPAGPPVRPPFEVGEVSIPATIDRDEIVLNAPGDRLDVIGTSIWGAPVRQLIRRALSDDLIERLPRGSVLPSGDPATSSGLRLLTVSIQRFEANTAGRVTLRAFWLLSRSGQPPSGTPHEVRVDVDAGAGTPAAVVPAMSRALGMMADQIAAVVS